MPCRTLGCEARGPGVFGAVDCILCRLRRDRAEAQEGVARMVVRHQQGLRNGQARLERLWNEVAVDQGRAGFRVGHAAPAPHSAMEAYRPVIRKPVARSPSAPAVQSSGADRRRHERWLVPSEALVLALDTTAGDALALLDVRDVSRYGIAGRVKDGHLLRVGVTIQWGVDTELAGSAVVHRLHGAVAVLTPVADSHFSPLVALARSRRGLVVRRGPAQAVRLEGHVGFRAINELRFSVKVSTIDLSLVTNIDSAGLGVLAGHAERGAQIQGCRGVVAGIMEVSGFCRKYCAAPCHSARILVIS